MNCTVYRTEDMPSELSAYIMRYMTKPESEFQKKLAAGEADGSIAVVFGDGSVIGWARSEQWADGERHNVWDTLEAFVKESERGKGVASFAARGLRAADAFDAYSCAVFDPLMMVVAKNAGLFPVLFEKKDSAWVRV